MTNVEPRVKSVLLDMSDRYGMEPAAFEATLRNTVVPNNCTKEQFAAFLLVAKEYKLNPLLKEIYAFPSKGGIQPIVGVDGWANLINSHPAFDGMDFEDHFEDGNLASITCKMYRKDRTHPITATEYLSECKRSTEPWQKWPRRMLRHKAMIQAARYAFSFAGIIDPDEAERVVGDLARDVTPRLADKLAAAQAIAPPVDADGFSREHVVSEIDGTNSNSSQVSSVATDTPASDPLAPNPADAGNHIQESSDGSPATDDGVQAGSELDKPGVGLPAGWQRIYADAMTAISDKPKSLATRRKEALLNFLSQPSDDDKAEMAAIEDLVKRRNSGELSPDAFKAALREIVPDERIYYAGLPVLELARAILATGLVADEAAIRASAFEEAARIAEGEVYKERYRTWPWWKHDADNIGNADRESALVKHADAIAAAIRSGGGE